MQPVICKFRDHDIILVYICATGFGFIDEIFAEIVCKKLEIQPQHLIKPKPIQRFDNRAAQLVTYAIYLTLSIENYTKSLVPLLITKFGQHPMIIGYLWMIKYRVLLNMINNSITFLLGYCIHLGAPLSPILPKLKGIEIISKVRHQNIFLNCILKWS